MAKGLANGFPAVATPTPEVADSLKCLTISTFGGNPVAARAAKATSDFIESEGPLENARVTSQYLRGCLEELQDKHPILGEIRGMGLMQGVELVKDRKTRQPAVGGMRR